MQSAGRAMRSTNHARRLPLAPLAVAIAFYFSGSSQAATILVNDPAEGGIAGKCTLSDAVAALNTGAAVHACAAGNGSNDTIDLSFFTSPTTITFTLAGAVDGKSALQIDKPATLSGSLGGTGQPLVTLKRSGVSGTPAFRLLAATANLTVSGLAIYGGSLADQGGGIHASGYATLDLENSVVSANFSTGSSGGGVAAECGAILLNNSTISGNSAFHGGGGIYTSNTNGSGGASCGTTITLNSTTVSGNTAGFACAGIYAFNGAVIADRSTIDGNVAAYAIGGIGAYQSVTLTNSTVSNNSAPNTFAGISSATITLVNTTMTGNHCGAIGCALGGKTLTLLFSTIANNTSSMAGGGAIFFDTYAHLVGNIVTSNVPYNILSSHTATVAGDHNISASSTSPNQSPLPAGTLDCNPKLGGYANNGGPTKTLGLLAGSCAIDAGPPTAPPQAATDQRGYTRPIGAATDIGAFEKQGPDDPDIVFTNGFES